MKSGGRVKDSFWLVGRSTRFFPTVFPLVGAIRANLTSSMPRAETGTGVGTCRFRRSATREALPLKKVISCLISDFRSKP